MRRVDYEIDNSWAEDPCAPRTKSVSGEPVGDLLAVRKGAVGWIIDHLPTGFVVAKFDEVPKARVLVMARAVSAAHDAELASIMRGEDAARYEQIGDTISRVGESLGLRRDGLGFWVVARGGRG